MKTTNLFWLVIFISALAGCKKDSPASTQPAGPTGPVTATTIDSNVYFVGTSTAAYPANIPLATVFNRGVATVFTGDLPSEADAIAFNGTDIYITGSGKSNTASLWKNGISTSLPGNYGNSGAVAITISNSDVYVGGWLTTYEGATVASYWKNGAATAVQASSTFATEANAIAVSGTDVYMAGFTFPFVANSNYEATVWKNGASTILATGNNGSIAYGIAVNGNDVYVVGVNNFQATVWKNGVAQQLAPSSTNSAAKAITISGNDIYISGVIDNVPVYWKNGTVNTLYNTKNANADPLAKAIGVDAGGNVYVAFGLDTAFNAIYWKNGNPVLIAKGQLAVNGIAIGPR